RDKESDPEKSLAVRLTRKFFPVSADFDGQNFLTKLNGVTALTPLALVLVLVETTDLIFALDSIPAIFSITTVPFLVFTSNSFALLASPPPQSAPPRSYLLFSHLKICLSILFVFIGVKMVAAKYFHIPTPLSLVVVVGIIAASILASVVSAWRERK